MIVSATNVLYFVLSCHQEIADNLCKFFSSKVSDLVSCFAATETSSCPDSTRIALHSVRRFAVSQQWVKMTSSSLSDILLLRRAVLTLCQHRFLRISPASLPHRSHASSTYSSLQASSPRNVNMIS